MMEKDLIIEAWTKYRPETAKNTPREDGEESPAKKGGSPKKKDIN